MPKLRSGILITFEGTEGSGKSTLMRQLSLLLEQQGQKTVQTREPGGHPLAEKLREILLHTPMAPRTELLLYEAARAEHLTQTVLPALQRGKIVLCDRFTASTLAYQGYARGLPWKEVKTLNRIATSGIQPDLVVFLDIDPAVGLSRARDPNRFEREGIQFQEQVRKGYLKAKREEPSRWLTLRADQETPEVLADRVFQKLRRKFKNHFPGKLRG